MNLFIYKQNNQKCNQYFVFTFQKKFTKYFFVYIKLDKILKTILKIDGCYDNYLRDNKTVTIQLI